MVLVVIVLPKPRFISLILISTWNLHINQVQAQLTFDRVWRSLGIWNRYTDVVQNSRFFDETIKNLKINNAETRHKIQALLSLEVFLILLHSRNWNKNLNWISWIFVLNRVIWIMICTLYIKIQRKCPSIINSRPKKMMKIVQWIQVVDWLHYYLID